MSIEIKTKSIEPLRHTFDNVARRMGADKPASRYLEAMFDLQPTVNFHYKPLWDSEHELFDSRRTAIRMADWYAFRDPRQFYYGTWTQARARQQEVAERNYAFVEKRALIDSIEPVQRERICQTLVPLRHLEYAANLNNCYITGYGYGTAVTQATMFAAIDRLGIAQYLSRIGLIFDGNSGQSLDAAKAAWTEAPVWQPLRRLAEDMLVTKDWFELFVAQDLALDGLLYPLVYERFDADFTRRHGTVVSILTEFMSDWYTETGRWVDATVKTAAAESEANGELLRTWLDHWSARAHEALLPLAEQVLGKERGPAVMSELREALKLRAAKLGLKG